MLKRDDVNLKEVEAKVTAFLEAHPECPEDIRSFLLRPEGTPPYVNPKDKLAYINNYNSVKAEVDALKNPVITRVSSIEEAFAISLEDHKLIQRPPETPTK